VHNPSGLNTDLHSHCLGAVYQNQWNYIHGNMIRVKNMPQTLLLNRFCAYSGILKNDSTSRKEINPLSSPKNTSHFFLSSFYVVSLDCFFKKALMAAVNQAIQLWERNCKITELKCLLVLGTGYRLLLRLPLSPAAPRERLRLPQEAQSRCLCPRLPSSSSQRSRDVARLGRDRTHAVSVPWGE